MTMTRGLVLGALVSALFAGAAFASGGTVKLKTDNTADGYFYNANGVAEARYCARYNAGEFDINATICGTRYRELDQSAQSPPVDIYTLGLDLRSTDPNFPQYADLTPLGLIALGDANSIASCSTTGGARTGTFGGGAGVPDPLTAFLITMPQPANNDPNPAATDFCGILLDTSSVFVNSARTQDYRIGALRTSITFNHFVEAVVFEPKEFDLTIRMTGSSRFAGDRGLPVQFARRACSGSDCVTDGTDTGPVATSDDFITGRFSIDNNTAAAPRPLNLIIEADRSALNPKLGPKDVTLFFKPIGGGGPIMNPVTFPNGRTLFNLQIKTVIKRKFLGGFPVDLPFVVRLQDPNNLADIPDTEAQALGLRQSTGYYDNDSHGGGFFFTQSPVLTGDAIGVRFDAVDLPKINNTTNVTGAQIVGGEFGASGLTGIDAFQLRREDAVLQGNPDLSPQGLFRNVGTIGDPGNADGTPIGLPASTVTLDFTNYVATPTANALALNLHGLAYLNPGDTLASLTAIGSAGGTDVFIGNSYTLLANTPPVSGFNNDDIEIRLDLGGELGTSASTGTKTKVIQTQVRERGRYIEVERGGISH